MLLQENFAEEHIRELQRVSRRDPVLFGTCCIRVWTVGSTREGWFALYFQRRHLPYAADGSSASVIYRY